MGLGLGLDFSAGFVAAVLVLKVVMGLGLGLDFSTGFVAAGAAKELVVVVGAAKGLVVVVLWWLGWRRTWLLSWVWVGVGVLGCCHGCGGCGGNWFLPWMRVGVRGNLGKK